MSDEADLADRGTGRTRPYEASPQSAANAVNLATIKAQLDQAERSASVWRWLGGIAAAAAITLGGWALALAQQAAVDHVRVDRLEQIEVGRAERIEQLVEAQARTSAQLEQIDRLLSEIRTDVRDMRAEGRRENGDRR